MKLQSITTMPLISLLMTNKNERKQQPPTKPKLHKNANSPKLVIIKKNKPIYKKSNHEINYQIIWNTHAPCRYIIAY